MGSCFILIILKFTSWWYPGYCSSYWRRSKGKGPAFLCQLSAELGKSFFFPLSFQLLLDYMGWERRWRVTHEQVPFPVLQDPLGMWGRQTPSKPRQHAASRMLQWTEESVLCSESGEDWEWMSVPGQQWDGAVVRNVKTSLAGSRKVSSDWR